MESSKAGKAKQEVGEKVVRCVPGALWRAFQRV